MTHFDPESYGPVFGPWLERLPLMALGPGHADETARANLAQLDLAVAFDGKLADPVMAECCHSGLWLAFDFLDESHEISQSIHTPTGSYWHAIMHRREPDASNSGYWYRKVGEHPIFKPLAQTIGTLNPALLRDGRWDPFAFIQMCETARGQGGAQEALCQKAQKIEWQILFDHCFAQAKGR